MSASFQKLASVTASTLRTEIGADGLETDPTEVVASLQCLPLDPVSADVAIRSGLGDYGEVLQTMCEGGLDIREGDILVTSSGSYPVRAAEEWTWRPDGTDTLLLYLKEPK